MAAETRPAPEQNARRPVGRPRADGRAQLARTDVLLTAAKLIAQNGYGGTSIRRIAGALDAAPASIFNLFPSKDVLLNELIAFAAAPSLAFYETLTALDLPPAVALYKSLYEETFLVASADRAFPSLFYLPELMKPGFEPAQRVRADMVAHYRALIEEGQRAHELIAADPALAAEQAFQLTETSIVAGPEAGALAPAEQARATAQLCLRGLLADPAQLGKIEEAAATIATRINLPGPANAQA